MAGSVFGLDFGTTNSLAAYINTDGRVLSLTNTEDSRPHPSTVWYRAGETIVGRAARDHLDSSGDAISGSFVRSPKRLLRHDAPIDVDGSWIDPRDIVAEVLSFLRRDAIAAIRGKSARELDRAVVTIPVELDGDGRRRMRDAARKAGIAIEQFVHEPLAALYGWLRSQPDYRAKLAQLEGRRVLVFDWGGGTLDVTLCLVRGSKLIQLANAGDNDIGGDYFDEVIRNRLRERHAESFGIDNIGHFETQDARIRLLQQCERAKIELSQDTDFPIFVPNYLQSDAGRALSESISRTDLEDWTKDLISRGLDLVDRLLEQHQLSPRDIELCLPTGGMVNLPAIRSGLVERFGGRVPKLENGDRVIAEGAAWIAHDQLRLSLAKPIEIEKPDGGYLELVPENQRLPRENEEIPIVGTQFYCCDPRDQVATFHFVRPTKIGYGARTAERQTYLTLPLKVDPWAQPFTERLDLKMSIDHDYIVKVDVRSGLRGDHQEGEIFNLEFALSLPHSSEELDSDNAEGEFSTVSVVSRAKGAVRLRSNVVNQANSWRDVPGDIIETWRPYWFNNEAANATPRQIAERDYYRLCSICKRNLCQIELNGCDCGHAISVAAASKRRAELGIEL